MRYLLLLITISFSSSLFAANCGALNQVPCTVFQRDIIKYGSCDKGLKQDFSKNRCVSANTPIFQAQPRPAHCGHQNQPPCGASLDYTPCEAPFEFYAGNGRCMSRQDIQAEEQRKTQRPANCGHQGQPVCAPSLYYTPCEAPNILHANGYCNPKPTRPSHCGHQNQLPCGVSLDYTPCEAPFEFYAGNGRCMSRQDIQAEENRARQRPANCGHQNQPPCAPSVHYTPCEAPNILQGNYCNPKPTRPSHCGHQNQPPCGVSLDYTPCEAPFEFYAGNGRCMSRQDIQAEESRKTQRPGNCGRQNQPPCPVSIHYTPCETPLQLHVGNGRCMSQQDIQAEEKRKTQRPDNCGHQNQRPCAFTEFFPSCDSGLQEAKGLCLTPQAAAPKPKARPGHCGRVDQPPCGFLEFFPSCESGLKEVKGRCQSLQTSNNGAPNPGSTIGTTGGNLGVVGSTPCGGPNQRPCLSSDENPETIAVPTTATSSCGGRGQRACCLGEIDVNATVSGPSVVGIPSSLNLNLSTTKHCSESFIEVPGCSGDCTCNGGGIANSMCTVLGDIAEPDAGWKDAGRPSQSARGYADLHLHLFGHMAHGGKVLVGKPYDTDCGGVTLPAGWENRSLAERVIGKDTVNQPACGKSQGVNKTLGSSDDLKVHSGHGLYTVIGGGTGDVAEQSNYGAPVFSGWPVWSSTIHQQAYYKWLERAWRGGLRTVVMFAVTNAALCKATAHVRDRNGVTPKIDCDDSMTPIKEQLLAAYQFEAFIQKNHPDQWFKIVKTPTEARQVVKDGKLAVVLGIEVDNLFNCKLLSAECRGLNLDKEIDKIYKLGVRHVIPIHNFENGFGAPAAWQSGIEVGNRAIEGSWWQTEQCPSGYGFTLSDKRVGSELTLLAGFGIPFTNPPARSETASCNKNGLSSLGKVLIKKLMDKGILIDIDHMSNKSFDETLLLATSREYPAPLVASHVQFFALNKQEIRHERMRTNEQLRAIRSTGGMIAAMLKDDVLDTDKLGTKYTVNYTAQNPGSQVADTCRHSSRTFAHMVQFAVDKMAGPVAFGSDFNGIAGHFNPRFGDKACGKDKAEQALQTNKMAYPFTLPGFGEFDRQVTGDKTFDYNFDGLAHVGLLPDLVKDLETVGLSPWYINKLFQSADAYIDVLERAERSAGITKTLRPKNCGRLGQISCSGSKITPCEEGLTDFRGRCSKLQ